MASDFRRSLKERAKERLGFTFSRPKSKSVDEGRQDDPEKENTSPSTQHFTPLPWDAAVSTETNRMERVQAPTHVEGDKSSRRLSGRLTQPKGSLEYAVSGNETLASIAAKFDTTTSELKKLNKLMTQMIWPGQKLFVPDKDYIPSSSSSPANSPVSTPREQKPLSFDIPLIKQTEPSRGPGLAKPVESPTATEPATRHLSEEDAQQLDKECTERFIKVNVKHITDGQGVVNGVLLVTPNAVMFDPNVSDPLVLEHGANTYGLIAPMETVRAVAMYQDIAAMKIKTSPESGLEPSTSKPAIYHTGNCPMAHPDLAQAGQDDSDLGDTGDLAEPDLIKDIPASGRDRKASICSCGADSLLEISSSVRSNSSQDGFLGSSSPAASANKSLLSKPVSFTKLTDLTIPEEDATGENCEDTAANTGFDKVRVPRSTDPRANDAPQVADAENSVNNNKSQDKMSHSDSQDSSQNAKISDNNAAVEVVISKDPVVKETRLKELRVDITQNSSKSDSLPITSSPRHNKPRTISSSSQDDPANAAANQNILSRTFGSITSFGSFTHSPNFSSLVDFSTGLFVRGQEESPGSSRRVKDISEVDMNTPPQRPMFIVGSKEGATISTDWSPFEQGEALEETGEADLPVHSISVPASTQEATRKPQVTNALSFSEKPELFKDLSELIPKPAVEYEDPPLYLCLRVGRLQKPQATTCPIEGYNKKRPKPEYWFSIPKEKVDPLYAFFIQWSPQLYGDEDEMDDPSSRGFVVIEDDELEEELEVVDDYFDKQQQQSYNRSRRISLSKGWEVISSDEVKRRHLEDFPVIPELMSPSAILEEEHTLKISDVLPPRAEGYPWNLTYCSAKDGFSLKTLYRNNTKVDSPALLVVMDTTGQVFGAMLSCGPKLSDHFYGSGETYLFTFYPEFKHFKWTGNNNFFVKGNAESLAVGAGEGSFGLWLDGDLYHGRTQHCETFNNDLLTSSEDFVVKALEIWTFM